MSGQLPVMVMNQNTKREQGRKAQLQNIQSAKAVSEIIRTTLGPKSMLKMILDPMGGIVMTNDGNSILREIDVSHPAAKSMIELSRTQEEEVGDGTSAVIIIAGEVMHVSQTFIERQMHPTVINAAYRDALNDALKVVKECSFPVDLNNDEELINIASTCIGTKFMSRWWEQLVKMGLKAVRTVYIEEEGRKIIDTKRFAKVEKIPGGELEDCEVLDGVMLNKDVTHPGMKRSIKNPRVVLLDCPMEYKKGESQTNVEAMNESDFETLLRMEEEYVENMCKHILRVKPDVVVTEKGISDHAQHWLKKAGVSCLRRARKTDNLRIARASGATIVHRPEEIKESDVGTKCGLFEVRKIGDEYFSYFVECKDHKACTILLRGASKDFLNEVERNLGDVIQVLRSVFQEPLLVPGGGAVEMSISTALNAKSKLVEGVKQLPYRTLGSAMEIIPRTLCENCGANTIRVITALRAKHADGKNTTFGVDGEKGVVADMKTLGVWEPFVVKEQTIKSAVESAMMLLRIDDIVSGITKKAPQGQQQQQPTPEEMEEAM